MTVMDLFKSDQCKRAVAAVQRRAERQEDINKLIDSFFDVGILAQIQCDDNQIVYGRRGTGKTHLLKVLKSRVENVSTVVVYIDLRTLGSTNQFSDLTLSVKQRCLSLFRDIFGQIHDELLDFICASANQNADKGLEVLSQLNESFTRTSSITTASEFQSRVKLSDSGTANATVSASISQGASASISSTESNLKEREEQIKETKSIISDNVVFPELDSALRRLLTVMNIRLFILLDEWSSIPRDIQQYLAEFIKRSVIANPKVTVKIGALEQRSTFYQRVRDDLTIGLEVGADISAALDLDDYYVFDRSPEQVTNMFMHILHGHLKVDLPMIGDDAESVFTFFSQKKAFEELVRASEGVARDLLYIFSKSYFASLKALRGNIDKPTIIECAREWYIQDKQGNLGEELSRVLERIVKEVIGDRKVRSFLIPAGLERHPKMQMLFDARVVHLVKRGYADKDNPGNRYNIYTLDFGTYVDLMNTSIAPKLDFEKTDMEDDKEHFVVPFDDKRRIRRVILHEKVFSDE